MKCYNFLCCKYHEKWLNRCAMLEDLECEERRAFNRISKIAKKVGFDKVFYHEKKKVAKK